VASASNVDRIVRDVGRCLPATSGCAPVIVAIAGPPGSGKSTLAAAVLAALGDRGIAAAPAPLDGWHRTEEELGRLGLLDVKGAPDTFDPSGYRRMLERILEVHAGEAGVDVPAFEHGQRDPQAAAYRVDRHTKVVVTEGNYLYLRDAPWSELRKLFTLAYWISAEAPVLRDRLIRRQVATGRSPEQATAWVDRSDLANVETVLARSALDGVTRLD
jgi:pantothenate kinase